MAAPTDYEQLILEMINRARLDPQAEADRYGIGLNQGLSAGTISPDSKQPLAYSSTLNSAAAGHSNWMLNTNTFSHTGAGGSNPRDRMEDAGYQFTGNWSWGENLSWNGTTGTLNLLNSALGAHQGLFESSGHRTNLMNGFFKEAGIGAETGQFQIYNAFMLTEKFATSGSGSFITGVAYNDADNDDFYSVGEGRGGVSVSLVKNGNGIGTGNSWSSGGYGVKTGQTGNIDVTFSGGGLPSAVTVTVTLGSENIKIDLVGHSRIKSSADTVLGQNATTLELLGLNDLDGTGNGSANTINGNDGRNELRGRGGDDTLYGRDGVDRLYGEGNDDRLYGGNQNDILSGGGGNDQLNGGGGNDVLRAHNGDDTLSGGSGEDTLEGGNDADTLTGGSGDDALYGQADNDLLKGSQNDDMLSGGAGDDTLMGGAGHDTLRGGAGDDDLRGGGGRDRLIGDAGVDILNGGSGSDSFVFGASDEGIDRVKDFTSGTDTLEIATAGFDNVLSTGSLGSNFFVQGTSATRNHGQFVYNQSNGDLAWDPDGTGGQAAEVFADLMNGTALSADDFSIV